MALREVLAFFGLEVDDSKAKKADKTVEGLIGRLNKLGQAVLTGFAAEKLFSFADGLAKTADEIGDTANILGISTQAVQEFTYVAKSGGDSAEELLGAMGRLQVSAAHAGKEGGEEAARAFANLKVKLKDSNGQVKAADELFLDVADAIAKTTNTTRRIGAVTDLFGRQGRALLPVLMQGREGISKLRAELVELGGGFDDAALAAGGEFQASQAKLGAVWQSIRARIAVDLLPVVGRLLEALVTVGKTFLVLAKNTAIIQVALAALGGAGAGLALKLLFSMRGLLGMAGAVAVVILVIEDLYQLFTGGESLIGAWVDKLFGPGTVKAMREWINENVRVTEAWEGLKLAISDVIEMFQLAGKIFSGTDFSAQDLKTIQRIAAARGAGALGDPLRLDLPTTNREKLETRFQQRISALKSGGSVSFAGEDNERINAALRQQLFAPQQNVFAPTKRAPGKTVAISSPVTLTVTGHPSPEDVRKAVNEVLDDRNRQAYDALTDETEKD